MSGHSKWSTIKHKKAASDAKRGKIFTKHGKLIEIAARNGGDPNMNPSLKAAIDNARSDNMPSHNIDRAIKKGTGESKDSAKFEEVIYEGFGPGGTALLIETLTDNRNRSITNIKIVMNKKGGTMGAAGSVGYLFERKGLIEVSIGGGNSDEIELAAIDAGATDIDGDDENVEVYTKLQQLMQVRDNLEKNGIKTKTAKIVFVPNTEADVNDEDTANKLMTLIDALEDDDDVSAVYTNANIADDLVGEI